MKKEITEFLTKNKTFIAFCAIIIIAAFFRLWQITDLPGGLFPDEAANGIDVNSILLGDRSPFFERGNGREGLFFYLLAISVEFFGRGPWQHHIVSALIGIAEVGIAFFLTRRMFGFKAAVLAAFFMATSTWHTVLSRTAFRAIMIPLFTSWTLFYIIRFIQDAKEKTRIVSAFLAGAFFALGFYTYIAYRIFPFVLLGLVGIFIYIHYKKYHRNIFEIFIHYKKYFAIAAVSFMIFISPLAYYFQTHPGAFIGRSGQVSVFSPDLNKGDLTGTILTVAKKTAWSFFTVGDANWRHNVSEQPFLPPTISIFFLLGLIYSAYRSLKYIFRATDFNDAKYLILLVWFIAMLIPEMTTAEGIPHGLRLIGAIPAVFIFPAIILSKIISCILEKFKNNSTIKSGLSIIIGFYAAIIFINSFNLYFGYYANSPEAYYAYRSDLTVVSDYLNFNSEYSNRMGSKTKTYLSLDAFSEQTVLYFTTETKNPYLLLLPEKSYEVKLQTGDEVVFTQSTLFDIGKFRETHPETKLVKQEKNKFGQTIMEVYQK